MNYPVSRNIVIKSIDLIDTQYLRKLRVKIKVLNSLMSFDVIFLVGKRAYRGLNDVFLKLIN